MMSLKAVIFDFDGTIIDTETAWYEAFREAYEAHGVELTLPLYAQCIGTSLHAFNPYEYLITEKNIPLDREQFRSTIHARHNSLMETETIRPGILAYLTQASAAGLRIGIASSSKRSWVDRFLQQLGIASFFETIRTAEDVKTVKPHPELYQLALQDLGVSPQEAVAIEDSPNGARAARAAGMHCLVIPNAITQHLVFEDGLRMLGSLEELPFAKLLEDPASNK